jgi:hypothetical protein
MSESKNSLAAQEWVTLQNNYEQYEKSALFIKLVSIVLFCICLLLSLDAIFSSVLMLILWLQEGIWKTYQCRLAARLLAVEKLIALGVRVEEKAFQLHTHWQTNRSGLPSLVKEYLINAVRPTVAFPYVVLLLINIFILIYSTRYQ